MTLRWPIFFRRAVVRTAAFILLVTTALPAATLTGQISLTNTKTKDLSGVVIWLEPTTPTALTPQHAKIIQKNKTFTPHILAIPTGTVVDFPNLDPIFHNAFSSFDGKVFDVGLYPPGSSASVRFDRPGIVRIFCNIHPAMSAVVAVVNSSWFAVSTQTGALKIESVPAGPYTLRVYHERATAQTLAALTRPITIQQDFVDLPTISISETGYLTAPHKNKFGKDYPGNVIYGEHKP